MHYSLQEQSTTQKVSTLGDFMEFLKRNSSLKKVESLPPEECSLCSNNQLDVFKISKSCKVSPYPCEGHECACFIQVGTTATLKEVGQSSANSTSSSSEIPHNETTENTTTIDPKSNHTNINEQQNANPSPPSTPTSTQYFPACFVCTTTVLYSKTNSFMRDNGRWRANCPFCKAEFCHLDLILASAPKKPQPKSKMANVKKKHFKNKKL